MGTHFSHGTAGTSPPEEEEGKGVEFFPVEQKIFEMPSVRAHDNAWPAIGPSGTCAIPFCAPWPHIWPAMDAY